MDLYSKKNNMINIIIKINQTNKTKKINLKKSTKSALLVGCNYTGSEYELYGCINDMNNLKNKLSTQYKFNNITLLTDNTTIKPTKENILNELKNLLINVNSGDTLIFCFSGHGSQNIDINNDEIDGLDELIVPLDFNYIDDDELTNIVSKYLKNGVNLFALFDSCHSGTILDLKYQYLNNSNKNNINLKYKKTNGNVIMISGCLDNQFSEDAYINNTSQGAMTWSFLESINKNPSIKWFDLIKNMRNLLKTNGYNQIPQLSSGIPISNTPIFL